MAKRPTKRNTPPGVMKKQSDLPPLCRPCDLLAGDCHYVCGQGPILRTASRSDRAKFGCYELENDSGLPEPAFDYPTRYEDFAWFQDPTHETPEEKKLREKAQLNALMERSSLPIPPMLPDRYPYRYTSAGPCKSVRTRKEVDVRRCLLRLLPVHKKKEGPSNRTFDPRDITQVHGYETTTMTDSLVPFWGKERIVAFKGSGIRKGLLESLYLPYSAHSEFDKYIIDTLHPNWQDDPLFRRRLIFHLKRKQ